MTATVLFFAVFHGVNTTTRLCVAEHTVYSIWYVYSLPALVYTVYARGQKEFRFFQANLHRGRVGSVGTYRRLIVLCNSRASASQAPPTSHRPVQCPLHNTGCGRSVRRVATPLTSY